MKRLWLGAFLLTNLILNNAVFLRAEADVPDPSALDQERRMKDDAEQKAQSICDSIMGKGHSSVLVNVELGLETTHKGGSAVERKLDNKSGGLGEDNFILPWVPAPKSVTKEEVPKDASVQTQASQQNSVDVRTVLKRFDITVIHDQDVPKVRVEMAKSTLESAFERYKSVLKVIFQASAFLTQGFDPKAQMQQNLWDFLKPQHLILLFLLLLALMLLKFFFGPLADFMKNYVDGMKEQAKSKVEMLNKSENENESETDNETEEDGTAGEGELTPEELEALALQEEQMQKFEPFKYVNDENIKQLAYLLHHEEPWIVAMVISYLTAEHGYKVMEALPADLQAKVALETAMYRQTSLEQVRAIDEDIKQKIDFVVGGMEKLVVILETSDRLSRDNILDYLKNQKPAIYEKVRERILLFEDIVNFPKLAMQVLVRELKTEQLARALRNTSPELQQKFYESMSQGAVTLLKEEMEYGRPVTDDQVEEERRKIVDMVKALETDGKISFRQKGKAGALSGDEMGSMSSAPTRSPEKSQEAYNAGMAAQEQGDMETALRHFETSMQFDPQSTVALQALANALYAAGQYEKAVSTYDALLLLEPNEQLQTWVDEVRATLAPAA
jgi:flagellar motor switch protein FliG